MKKFQTLITSETVGISSVRANDMNEVFEIMLNNKGHNKIKIIEGRSFWAKTVKQHILNQQSKVCRWGTNPMDASKSFGPSIENHNKQMRDKLKNKKRDFDVLLYEQSQNRIESAFRVVTDREYQNNEILKATEHIINGSKGSKENISAEEVTLRFAKNGRNSKRQNDQKFVRAKDLAANHVANKINNTVLAMNSSSDKSITSEQEILSDFFTFPPEQINESKKKRIRDNLKKIELLLSFQSENFITFNTLKVNDVDHRIMMPSVSVFKLENEEMPTCMLSMYSKVLYESGLYQDNNTSLQLKTCYISIAHTSVIIENNSDEILEFIPIRSQISALNEEAVTRNRTPSKIVIAFCVEGAAYIQV